MQTEDYFRVALSSLIRMIRYLIRVSCTPSRYETREEPVRWISPANCRIACPFSDRRQLRLIEIARVLERLDQCASRSRASLLLALFLTRLLSPRGFLGHCVIRERRLIGDNGLDHFTDI